MQLNRRKRLPAPLTAGLSGQHEGKKLDETKKQMLKAIGSNAYGGDVFQGTTPAPADTGPNKRHGGVDPSDQALTSHNF